MKIDFVHSLEHGRMEIQYSPELAEGDQLALKGLYETIYAATLLFPNDEMPYEVAATTWTNLLGCKKYKGAITLDAIRDFGKATWGNTAPSRSKAFPFTGPTPRTGSRRPASGAAGRRGRSRRLARRRRAARRRPGRRPAPRCARPARGWRSRA